MTDHDRTTHQLRRRLRLTLVLAAALLVPSAVVGAALAAPAGAATLAWEQKAAGVMPDVDFRAVSAYDATHVLAVGYQGGDLAGEVVRKSTDGGATWTGVALPVIEGYEGYYSAIDVKFVDQAHGWVAARWDSVPPATGAGSIFATVNGGATWTTQMVGVNVAIDSIDFVDASYGWAVGEDPDTYAGRVYSTANGGVTWTRQAAAMTLDGMRNVDFFDRLHGYMATAFKVYATSDGGATWTVKKSFDAAGNVSIRRVSAVDATHAFVDAGDNYAADSVIATADGGTTWSAPKAAPTNSYGNFVFASLTRGWMTGDGSAGVPGGIYGTTDGGAHWTLEKASPVDSYGGRVSFAGLCARDTTHAWAVAGGGTIFGYSPLTTPITTPSGDAKWYSSAAAVTLTAADNSGTGIASVTAKVDGGASTTTPGATKTVSVPAPATHANDGIHFIYYHATDNAAKVEPDQTCWVGIDTAAPYGSIGFSSATTTTPVVYVNMNVQDDGSGMAKMRFSVDGKVTWSAWEDFASSTQVRLPWGNGAKTVWAQCQDALGHIAQFSGTVTLNAPADTTPPTVLVKGVDQMWHQSAVTVAMTGNDNLSGVVSITYKVDAATAVTVPGDKASVVISAPGIHSVAVSAVDAAGNHSVTTTYTVNIGPTPPGAGRWTPQLVSPLGTPMWDVDFVDTLHGWSVGGSPGHPVIKRSVDGGATWTTQTIPALPAGTTLKYVKFADLTHGWAVGCSSAVADNGPVANPVVLHTADGGVTWQRQTVSVATSIQGFDCTDLNHAWILGDQSAPGGAVNIIATANGGATWAAQASGTTGYARGIDFVDNLHGWAFTATFVSPIHGLVLATADGGKTWTKQNLGVFSKPWDIFFLDQKNGWAIGYEGYYLFRTTNGGVTWTRYAAPTHGTGDVTALSFVSPTVGYGAAYPYGGGSPFIYKTTDGGATWASNYALPATQTTAYCESGAIDFVDATHGWVASNTSSSSYPYLWTGTVLGYTVAPPVAPKLTSFTPASGPAGTVVTLTGTGLTGATKVAFHGVAATSFSVVSATQIKATVPTGATTGTIAVTTPGGTCASAASFTVTPKITITAPTATSSWPSGSTQTVAWTMSPAVSVGEFRVGLINAAGTTSYINKQVLPTAGKTSYSTSFAASVPGAAGYKAYVYYRPVVGTGSWTATARSAAFAVTPIRITAPTATSSWPSGSTQTVAWTMSPAVSVGEFRVGLINAAGTTSYINKQVLPTAGKTSYSTSFAASVPGAAGYKAYVYYRPVVGTGSWTATARSAAFTVTP